MKLTRVLREKTIKELDNARNEANKKARADYEARRKNAEAEASRTHKKETQWPYDPVDFLVINQISPLSRLGESGGSASFTDILYHNAFALSRGFLKFS